MTSIPAIFNFQDNSRIDPFCLNFGAVPGMRFLHHADLIFSPVSLICLEKVVGKNDKHIYSPKGGLTVI